MSGGRLAGWAGRVALSLFGATLGGLVASLIDGLQAVGAATSASAPHLGPTFLADAGVVAPVAALLGLAVGLGLVVLEPGEARTPASLWRSLDGGDADARPRAAAFLLAPLAAFAWLTLVAHDARHTFALAEGPRAAGASLAVTAALLGVGLALLALRAARGLGAVLPRGLRPAFALGGGLALAAALLAFGVASGTTGGEGGVLGIFGVLKRAELDLRAPGLALLIAAAGALGAGLHRRLFAPLAAALALLPVVLTLWSARALDASPALTASLERQAPLGKIGLRLARRLTDADHDGFSRTFGGGDCNDRDARIYPTAIDEPGNGIDEDCSGSDAPLPTIEPPPAVTAAPKAPAAAREPLNVLLITVDTLRGDLGYNGNPRPVSPSLDALAAQSTIYENAYSLASYTGKSIGPMMMGKYPSESHRGWSHFNAFSKEDTMVADRLKAAGVHTLSLQAHWYFNECCGLARGFEVVDKSAGPPPGTQQDNDTNTTSDKLTDAAIKRLSDPTFTGGKFFTWVHYLDPHADYLHHPGTTEFGHGMRDQYDHEVAFTDQQVGRLLAFVAAQPWAAHTAIVVTSDHGEAFGEHKLIRHGFEVWEELMRVPLIVHVPGVAPSRVKPRRSLIDLVPTILDLEGVHPAFDGGPFDFISGKSLLPDMALPPGESPEERDVFVDMPAGPNNDDRRAFYHGNQKLYISSGYSYTLYDLAADPGEKTDLAESQKEALADMKSRYEAFKAHLHEVRVKPIPK